MSKSYLIDKENKPIMCDYIGCKKYAIHRVKRPYGELLNPQYSCEKHLKDMSTNVLLFVNENGEWETKELYCSLNDYHANN